MLPVAFTRFVMLIYSVSGGTVGATPLRAATPRPNAVSTSGLPLAGSLPTVR